MSEILFAPLFYTSEFPLPVLISSIKEINNISNLSDLSMMIQFFPKNEIGTMKNSPLKRVERDKSDALAKRGQR